MLRFVQSHGEKEEKTDEQRKGGDKERGKERDHEELMEASG